MDKFDELYNEKLTGINGDFDESKNQLLEDKRNKLYEFFSNQKTLAILILLGIGLLGILSNGIYMLTNPMMNMDGMGNGTIISTGISLVLAGILPYALFMLHTGSKEKNPDKFNKGLKTARSYTQMLKVITIIYSAFVGLMFLILLFVEPMTFIFLLFVGGIVALMLYIIKIFTEFVEGLKATFNKTNNAIPSARRIYIIFIIYFVITVLALIGAIVMYEMFVQYLPEIIAEIEAETLQDFPYEFDIVSMLEMFVRLRFIVYALAAVQIAIQAFYLHYIRSFEKEFQAYNIEHKNKLRRIRELEFENQEE